MGQIQIARLRICAAQTARRRRYRSQNPRPSKLRRGAKHSSPGTPDMGAIRLQPARLSASCDVGTGLNGPVPGHSRQQGRHRAEIRQPCHRQAQTGQSGEARPASTHRQRQHGSGEGNDSCHQTHLPLQCPTHFAAPDYRKPRTNPGCRPTIQYVQATSVGFQ